MNVLKQKAQKNAKTLHELAETISLKKRQLERRVAELQQNSFKNMVAQSPKLEKLMMNKEVQREIARLDKVNGYNLPGKVYDDVWQELADKLPHRKT